MKIIITRNCFIGGRLIVANPEAVDLPEAEAKQLLVMEKAVKAPDPVPVAVETPALRTINQERRQDKE